MNEEDVKESLRNLFDRAIISLSYGAANRIVLLISDTDQSIKTSFVIFIISLTAMFDFLNSKLLQNTGIQTSLSIVMSKLVISMFPLPEEQRVFCLLPSIIFYLVLCSCICILIDNIVLHSSNIQMLWKRIVPFIVLFTSSITIQIFTNGGQMRQLYLVSLCYIIFIQYKYIKDSAQYLNFFFDSLLCRSLVLLIQDYVKSNIDNMDLAVVAFNASIIIIGYSIGSLLSQQIRYCIGVLTFTISQQLLAILQKKCNDQNMPPFVIAVMAMTIFLYNRHLGMPICNISINCISLAWSALVEIWISSFYNIYEPFLIYIIVFVSLQSLQEFALSVYDFSEGKFSKDLLVYNYELMVIAHDTSSSVGLPSFF